VSRKVYTHDFSLAMRNGTGRLTTPLTSWFTPRLLTIVLLICSCVLGATVLRYPRPDAGHIIAPAVAVVSPQHAHAPVDPAAQLGQAEVVVTFVQSTLVPRVLVVEGTLSVANHHVSAHLAGAEDAGALARVLTQQAFILTAASADFSSLQPPRLDARATLQMQRVLEDLALVSDQLADLLGEAALALQILPTLEAIGATIAEEAISSVAFGRRVHSALSILRRADAWLETIDHETGAHASLPGFAPGAPSLQSQLAMQ
jgi:hypothetical protein